MAAKIYITGATGRLGREVYKDIRAVPLVRSHSGLENEVMLEFADLGKTLADADVIIHLAGSIMGDFQKSNVELTQRIVDAAPQKAKIIYASSISVFGKKLRQIPADEDTPVNPDSDYSRSKLAAEEIVRKHDNHCILRIATIYGEQFDDFTYVIRMVEEGKMRLIGEGKNLVPFVHVEDASNAIVKAIKKGSGTYVISGDSLSQERIFDIVSSELGVAKPRKIPKLLARILVKIGELKGSLSGKKPRLTKEHLDILSANRVFDCSRARKDLSFRPRPLKDGIREIVKKYKRL